MVPSRDDGKGIRTRYSSLAEWAWVQLQYMVLALTILGQVTVGASYLLGQGVWMVANVASLARDFALKRPASDKVKDAAMCGLTLGLIIAYQII